MPRFSFVILTPTFNRAALIETQLAHLAQEARELKENVLHVIVDDGSDPAQDYSSLMQRYRQPDYYKIDYRRLDVNHGRDGFWKVCNFLFAKACNVQFEYAVMLADDLMLCRDFLHRIRKNFQFLQKQDNRCVCLNIFSRWPVNWDVRYEDGAFIATRRFFEAFRWQVEPIPPQRWDGDRSKKYLSTGVHQQITNRLKRSRFNIATATGISYVKTMECESALYPEAKFPGRAQRQRPAPMDIFVDD